MVVLFDMDGVIFDTEHLAVRVWKKAAEELGIPDVEQVFYSCIGTTLVRTREILRAHYGEDFPQEQFDRCVRKHYFEHYDRFGLPVKTGAEETLAFLKGKNVPLAIASSTRSEMVRRELQDAGLLTYFDAVVGGDLVTHSKPHPEIFLRAAETLNAKPAEAFVIEDSYNGIRAAAAAGMHPLMVPDMLPPTEEIRSLAERIFPSLHEVRAFFAARIAEGGENHELLNCAARAGAAREYRRHRQNLHLRRRRPAPHPAAGFSHG